MKKSMQQIKSLFLNTKLFYFLIFITFSIIFLGHYVVAGQAVYGDGIEYYQWLRSAYFDRDINFLNEVTHNYSPIYNNNYPNFSGHPPEPTQSGKIGNFHMPGMAILLLPFFFIADILCLVLNFFGINTLRNGYSDIYQIISGLGAIFYATLGIFITEKLLSSIFSIKKMYSFKKIRLSILTVVLSSSIFYYASIDVLNSHFATFFIVSVFYYYLFTKPFKKTTFILLGLIMGLATWIRIQEIALIIPFLVYTIYSYFKNKIKLNTTIVYIFLSFATLMASLVPLIAAWQYLYANFLLHPYFVGFAASANINWLGSLIDPMNGLFTKTPFMLFLLIMIPFVYKNFKKEFLIFLLFFIIQFIGISKYGGWPAASFGARMYISAFPLFFLLAGALFLKIEKKLIIAITIFFILINVLNIFNFMLFNKEAANGNTGLEPDTKQKIDRILKYF